MGRKKGTVEFDESPPDDFDAANPYKDPVAMLEMREHIVREKWIDIEKAKILRDRVKWTAATLPSTAPRSSPSSPTDAQPGLMEV
ncbi:hypothetical protein NL676_002106 [Syzygium grande]|nr:hypothetical protein NL676_002106 [Syzygium grande]